MKFEEIIRATGLNADNYPLLAKLPIKVYDRKRNPIFSIRDYVSDGKLFFTPESKKIFEDTIVGIEKELSEGDDFSPLEIKITDKFISIIPYLKSTILIYR